MTNSELLKLLIKIEITKFAIFTDEMTLHMKEP